MPDSVVHKLAEDQGDVRSVLGGEHNPCSGDAGLYGVSGSDGLGCALDDSAGGLLDVHETQVAGLEHVVDDGDALEAGHASPEYFLDGPRRRALHLHIEQSGNGLEGIAHPVVDLADQGTEELGSFLNLLVEPGVVDGDRGGVRQGLRQSAVFLVELARGFSIEVEDPDGVVSRDEGNSNCGLEIAFASEGAIAEAAVPAQVRADQYSPGLGSPACESFAWGKMPI